MTDEPNHHDQDNQDRKTLVALVAVLLLIGITVFLMVKLKHGEAMQDCFAQGRRNCDPIDMSQ